MFLFREAINVKCAQGHTNFELIVKRLIVLQEMNYKELIALDKKVLP